MKTGYLAFGVLSLALAVTACSTEKSAAPSGLSSSRQLQTDEAVRGAYIYRAPNMNAAKYQRLLIEPTVIYGGREANFEGFSEEEKRKFAATVNDEFRKVLAGKFQIVNAPAADVIRVRTTLVGVKATTGGVATVTRVLPIGLAINAVRGAAGAGGSLTGGIDIAVEVFDAQTNELLVSAVRNETPGVLDIEATLSTNDTVEASARGVAEELRDGIARRAPHMVRK